MLTRLNKDTTYYFDADGVISDFDDFLCRKAGKVVRDPAEGHKIMTSFYKDCFYDSKETPNAKDYLRIIRNNSNCYVLTALSKRENISKYCNNAEEVLAVHKENKYRWFEERGISRDKVIIVEKAKDKLNFAREDTILYDDRKDIVEKWVKLGGIGILIPNPIWS